MISSCGFKTYIFGRMGRVALGISGFEKGPFLIWASLLWLLIGETSFLILPSPQAILFMPCYFLWPCCLRHGNKAGGGETTKEAQSHMSLRAAYLVVVVVGWEVCVHYWLKVGSVSQQTRFSRSYYLNCHFLDSNSCKPDLIQFHQSAKNTTSVSCSATLLSFLWINRAFWTGDPLSQY